LHRARPARHDASLLGNDHTKLRIAFRRDCRLTDAQATSSRRFDRITLSTASHEQIHNRPRPNWIALRSASREASPVRVALAEHMIAFLVSDRIPPILDMFRNTWASRALLGCDDNELPSSEQSAADRRAVIRAKDRPLGLRLLITTAFIRMSQRYCRIRLFVGPLPRTLCPTCSLQVPRTFASLPQTNRFPSWLFRMAAMCVSAHLRATLWRHRQSIWSGSARSSALGIAAAVWILRSEQDVLRLGTQLYHALLG